MSHIKNYIFFGNDHSGSMHGLTSAAKRDFNANIKAVKEASTKQMQDTIVSVFGFGIGPGGITRQIVNSNPHVLQPMANWPAQGGTPLFRTVLEIIKLAKSMPDYADPNVSFVVLMTTDGGDTQGGGADVAAAIRELTQRDGRWTFVFRVPANEVDTLAGIGIPRGNIQAWDQTAAGFANSTQATEAAFNNFYAARATGQKSSTVFYAQAGAVDTSSLVDVTKDVSLYVVPSLAVGEKLEIRDFILTKRMQYLKGAAFYQLTKTEARVQPSKMILVRDRTTKKIYGGKDKQGKDIPRQMLGLPTDSNVRLHPGDHGNFDIFIQSSSVNRHLVGDTGVVYWEAIGVPFTEADLAYLQPKKPAEIELPAVPVSNKPTPHPQKVAKKAVPTQAQVIAKTAAPAGFFGAPRPILPTDGGRVRYHVAPLNAAFYDTRDMARAQATVQGKKQYDAGPTAAYGKRFYIV
jgi:hypothetical protein